MFQLVWRQSCLQERRRLPFAPSSERKPPMNSIDLAPGDAAQRQQFPIERIIFEATEGDSARGGGG
jgi:hypothetical protein